MTRPHLDFSCRGSGRHDFEGLIRAAFLIAWDDPVTDIPWHDACKVEVPLAGSIEKLSGCSIVFPGRFLAWRRDLVDLIHNRFGPIFATELDCGGLPLATQSGISSLVISRPPAHPSGHDRLEASATLRQTLKHLDIGDPRIHRLIGPLD